MVRYCKIVTSLVMILMVISVLVGCGEDEQQSTVCIGIVPGVHMNSKVPSLNDADIQKGLNEACRSYGRVIITRCDGKPEVVFKTDIPRAKEGLSSNKLQSIAKGQVSELMAWISTVQAETPEVDTLQAIRITAMEMKAAEQTEDQMVMEMWILDTGLSTTGYMDFTRGILDASPQAVVSELERLKALPDLNGIRVYWRCFAQSAAPQEALSRSQISRLEEIWEAVLYASGAESVDIDETGETGEIYTGLPPVSTVEAESSTMDVTISTMILDETKIQFIGDSDEFVDRKRAEEAVRPVAEQLMDHPGSRVLIVGTTGGGVSGEFCQELSERRALAVKKLLMELGVSAEQIDCIGMGAQDPWHVEDMDASGNLIEEKAAKNRKVVVMDVNSPDAEEVYRWEKSN